MPLVRIDVQQGRTPEELRKLADTIQDVMLDVFAAPPRDRYQIITEHDKGHIIAEDTGLGLDRSDGIVIIQIFQQGRSNRAEGCRLRRTGQAVGGGMRRTAGGFDHFGDVEQACRLVVRSGPSPIHGRHVALADLGLYAHLSVQRIDTTN